jgi:hypothetical protein
MKHLKSFNQINESAQEKVKITSYAELKKIVENSNFLEDTKDIANLDEKISYICDNVNELRKPYRIEILQHILGSNINRNKIKEKGCGTQVKICDIPKDLISVLYNFIKIKMKAQEDELHESDIHFKK